ncbi:MAG: hypothetical protein IKZ53_02685 [Selenomonadaceae bacterium]|nr:hypothetical protein [Selenomonadaceae bacterium]
MKNIFVYAQFIIHENNYQYLLKNIFDKVLRGCKKFQKYLTISDDVSKGDNFNINGTNYKISGSKLVRK